MEEGLGRATPRRRTHRWIAPVLGAILGFILGTAVVSLAAAYMPEGSSEFTTLGITLQAIGALLGLFIGGLLTRSRE
jgi:hypothetical protein